MPHDAPRRRPHARRLASSPPSDSVEGYRRARVERVNCVDIPDPGPNQNFRSARGHVVSYTRVLTATLCTVTDGLDRLLPIVASATVSPRLAEMNRSYDVDAAGGLDEYYYEEPAEDSLEDSLKDHLRWVRVLPRHQPGDDAVDDIDADTNAREPLHAAYRYIRNCLHPARHPDVIKARRQRSKLATDFEGSPSLDNFVAALGTMPPDMIRARFASNHTGHYGDDWGGGHYDPLELLNTNSNRNEYSDHSEGYWALRGVVETDTLEAIEYFDRCFYGYAVSEVPAPVAPPPLRELRMAPRAVEELVLELENVDAWGVHVRVDLSVGHPGYEARMWGWWPADDTECMLCEVELTVSDREWPFAAGNGVGVEAILGLCAAMKHDLPVYVSAEVIDLLSVHPDGWKPSFAVNQPGYDVEHVYTGRDTRYRGFFYTPENGDDLADPRLFDVFLRFLRNQFGGGRMLRVLAPYHNGERPATSKKPSPPNLADALLKGPAAFFFEIIKTWATWRHRWHGFALYGTENASPALSSQTGKSGTLARDAERRAMRPPSRATRYTLDGTIAHQATLAVLLWRLRMLEVAGGDADGAFFYLRTGNLTDVMFCLQGSRTFAFRSWLTRRTTGTEVSTLARGQPWPSCAGTWRA